MNRAVLFVLGIGAVSLAAITYKFPPWSSPFSTINDRSKADAPLGDRDLGVYYRMTAKYTYKGDPLILDFGISCGSIWKDPKQHKYSMDVFSGPKLYGVRTKDGKAVVVSTRNFCDTLRPNEPNWGAPEDFLPITFVYDDPDTLYSATMYASDEAYRNLSSVLTEPNVRFERLTAEQLQALRKSQAPNVVRSVENDGRAGGDHKPPWRNHKIQNHCLGVTMLTLTEDGRELVRKYWPESRPNYWWLGDNAAEIHSIIQQRKPETVVGGNGETIAVAHYMGRASGLLRTSGQGARLYGGGDIYYIPPVFPIVPRKLLDWDASEQRWSSSGELHYIVDLSDAARGFLACGHPVTRGPTAEAQILMDPSKRSELRERFFTARFTVGDQSIFGTDGHEMRGIGFGWKSRVFMYRDQKIFVETNADGGGSVGEQGDE